MTTVRVTWLYACACSWPRHHHTHTLEMASTQVDETSFAKNSPFQDLITQVIVFQSKCIISYRLSCVKCVHRAFSLLYLAVVRDFSQSMNRF